MSKKRNYAFDDEEFSDEITEKTAKSIERQLKKARVHKQNRKRQRDAFNKRHDN